MSQFLQSHGVPTHSHREALQYCPHSIPRFVSQPSPTSVHIGDSQVMACEVNFDLVPFTHWEKDKEALELSDRLIQLPSGALVISNASQTDAGLYRCVVENVGSSKSSDEAPLQTIPETGGERKLEFLVQPASVAKLLGSGVLLPCVVSGYPAPHIRWMFGEKVLEESDGRVEVVGGGSLQISNITEEDAGIYTCVAENSNTTIETQAQLTVQVPPQFVKRPVNIYAHESMDIIFECEVSGSPAPTVKWVKNGDAVIPSDYFKIIKEHNLQVLGLVTSDEGFYQCLAENDAGNIQSSAQLIILDHGADHGVEVERAPHLQRLLVLNATVRGSIPILGTLAACLSPHFSLPISCLKTVDEGQ
ncbi:putative aminophospholipid-translocase [Crenichthys baileyi]|uniref:Aminophospholipid-translocase n=1 Tax=Crenichthys baileyi TaxID=28760 RepID=A0AAV9SQL0_9TELE